MSAADIVRTYSGSKPTRKTGSTIESQSKRENNFVVNFEDKPHQLVINISKSDHASGMSPHELGIVLKTMSVRLFKGESCYGHVDKGQNGYTVYKEVIVKTNGKKDCYLDTIEQTCRHCAMGTFKFDRHGCKHHGTDEKDRKDGFDSPLFVAKILMRSKDTSEWFAKTVDYVFKTNENGEICYLPSSSHDVQYGHPLLFTNATFYSDIGAQILEAFKYKNMNVNNKRVHYPIPLKIKNVNGKSYKEATATATTTATATVPEAFSKVTEEDDIAISDDDSVHQNDNVSEIETHSVRSVSESTTNQTELDNQLEVAQKRIDLAKMRIEAAKLEKELQELEGSGPGEEYYGLPSPPMYNHGYHQQMYPQPMMYPPQMYSQHQMYHQQGMPPQGPVQERTESVDESIKDEKA